MKNKSGIIRFAKDAIRVESEAVKRQVGHVDLNFVEAASTIYYCHGRGARLIITGVGKSGLVGRKIAATFSSLGVAAMYVHPTEMLHGDLGMLGKGDVVMFLSYSGETEELKKIFPAVKEFKLGSIALTGSVKSAVARLADCVIDVSVEREACCYNLVPTASSTAMLAMGDALALSVAELRGFRKEEFARFHPGGAIGKKLTLKVGHIMRSGADMPVVREGAPVSKALEAMTSKKLGAVIAVNSRGVLTGYFTDGDLRRKIQEDPHLLKRRLRDVMTKNPRVVGPGVMAGEAAKMFKEHNFDNMPVVDIKGRPVGIIDERDMITTGVWES
jgi:arabinose-5-phosphate isomerase